MKYLRSSNIGFIFVPLFVFAMPVFVAQAALVNCGRSGQPMCNLCDIIVGINYLIKYGFGIAAIFGLTALTIGAVMYVVSAGDPKLIESAKGLMTNAGKGLIIILAAGFIVNVTMAILGAKPGLGVKNVNPGPLKYIWSNYQCTPSR